MRFEVPMAVGIQNALFYSITSFNPVNQMTIFTYAPNCTVLHLTVITFCELIKSYSHILIN